MDGHRIAQLREAKRLSQEELADLLNVHVTTLSRWENGHFEPKASAIQKLCSALHVTEAELLSGPEPKEIRITLHYSEMPKEGEINMNGNEFDLYMSANGNLGIRGGAKFASLEDIDGFIARAKEQLVEAFTFQQSRGAIPATA